jgi:hypothetical protein
MKSLIVTGLLVTVGAMTLATQAYADTRYCRQNIADPLCADSPNNLNSANDGRGMRLYNNQSRYRIYQGHRHSDGYYRDRGYYGSGFFGLF